MDKAYLAENEGSPAVGERAAGYQWAKNTVNGWGCGNDKYWIKACHLLPKQVSGTGRDLADLSACTRPTNFWVRGADCSDENFRTYETAVSKAVARNHVVRYSVRPNYTGDRVVADSWTFTRPHGERTANHTYSSTM